MDQTTLIVIGALVNLVAVLGVGWRISRFMARMELKVDILWGEYVIRTVPNHKRVLYGNEEQSQS